MQVNGKVTVTLEGVATVLRVLQEKLSVMPEGAASALKQIHSQVDLRKASSCELDGEIQDLPATG